MVSAQRCLKLGVIAGIALALGSLSGGGSSQAATAVVSGTSGLVAAYAFDEGSGSTVADASGNGNTGSVNAATWTTGKNGGALSFNGSSSWVTVPDAPALDLTSAVTLEAWVRPNTLSGWRAIVEKEQPNELVYALYANSDTNQPDGIVFTGGAEADTRGGGQLANGAWSHVAMTYDGAALNVYVNGARVTSRAVSGPIATSASPLRIGGNSVWGEYFNGAIDDVRVYNRALSAGEIQTDMTTPVAGAAAVVSAPTSTTAPTISGDAVDGSTLTASSGSWTSSPTAYGYQWSRCDASGGSCAAISGATAKTYTVAGSDVGDTIRVTVTASNSAGSSSATSAQKGPVKSALVAAYGFDEAAGTSVADASGNGNSGSISGATWSSGKFGSALSFDGAGDFVSIPDSASLDLKKAMTLEAWVKPSTLSGWRAVVVKEQPSELVYALYANSDTSQPAGIVYPNGGAGESIARGSSQIPVATWTHLAATYDGSTVRVYVNGSLAGSLASAGSISTSANPLKIGGNAIWGEWFSGLIDEVRVYSRALSASEIQTDMNAAVTGSAPPPPPAPSPGDTSPPSVPSGLVVSGVSGSSLVLSWQASSDDVGVVGYGVYRDGVGVGSTGGTSFTFSGLACGTTYVLGVDAFDAAGNRSQRASVSGVTSACSSGSGASLFVSGSGSDLGSCSQSAPCRSFQRAYDVAQPGQVVEVAGGSYPDQTLTGTKSAPRVVFRPAAGASVFVSDIYVYADNLELRDLKTGYWASYAASNGLVMRNIDTGPFIIFGSANTSVIGGDVGPSFGNGSATNDAFITYENGTTAPTNVLIDGVYFHDFKLGYVGDHGQCLMVVGGNGVTIRNSRFQRCDIYSIFFTSWAGPQPATNVLLENNFFDHSTNYGSYTTCCTYYSVQFASNMGSQTNITVRNNSALQPISWEDGVPRSNDNMIGNLAPNSSCPAGVSFRYNVFQGSACSSSDRSVSNLGFQNPGALDLHLTSTSPALNAGDPTNYPTTDIDGGARPVGGAPDAGADEAG